MKNKKQEKKEERERVTLELVDISVHERDWKSFKKTASQDDLLILGIGVKYRLNTKRLISYLSLLGIILSVVIGGVFFAMGMDFGLIILIGGYAVFSFMATKFIRYNDSFEKINKQLKGDYKAALKGTFGVSAGKAFIDSLVSFVILFITIPYQAIMMLIGMFAPNFFVAKNGVLLAIPKGYDIGNLTAIGAYYSSISLLDDWAQTSYNESHKYTATIINDMGCEVELHSANNIDYYDDNGTCYVSHDYGKTFIKN